MVGFLTAQWKWSRVVKNSCVRYFSKFTFVSICLKNIQLGADSIEVTNSDFWKIKFYNNLDTCRQFKRTAYSTKALPTLPSPLLWFTETCESSPPHKKIYIYSPLWLQKWFEVLLPCQWTNQTKCADSQHTYYVGQHFWHGNKLEIFTTKKSSIPKVFIENTTISEKPT